MTYQSWVSSDALGTYVEVDISRTLHEAGQPPREFLSYRDSAAQVKPSENRRIKRIDDLSRGQSQRGVELQPVRPERSVNAPQMEGAVSGIDEHTNAVARIGGMTC